jgi:hypothetical protein
MYLKLLLILTTLISKSAIANTTNLPPGSNAITFFGDFAGISLASNNRNQGLPTNAITTSSIEFQSIDANLGRVMLKRIDANNTEPFILLGTYSPANDFIGPSCILNKQLIVTGFLWSLSGLDRKNTPIVVAYYNETTQSFKPVSNGLQEIISLNQTLRITSLLCDEGSNSIWISSPSIPGNIARYINSSWLYGSSMTSGGLNGPVYDITPTADNTLLLGGNFNATNETFVNDPFRFEINYIPSLV